MTTSQSDRNDSWDSWDSWDDDDPDDDLDDIWMDDLVPGEGMPDEELDGALTLARGAIPALGTCLETDEQVLDLFLGLIGPERDGPRAVWVLLLDSGGRALPVVVPISDLPTMVDREFVTNLAGIMAAASRENAPGGSVALALVRQDGGDRGSYEVDWSRALVEAMTQVGLPVRAIVAVGRDRARVLPGRSG